MRKASIIAMAALALLTAQCKKNEPKPEEKVMVPITGSVDFGGSKTEITTSGMINPVDGDVIYIYDNGINVGSMTCTAQAGQQFTCSGEIDQECLGTTCTFMYLGTGSTEADGTTDISKTSSTISFADQTGVSVSDNKISGLEKFHVGSCKATVSETGTVTLPMATKMSIAYFQLTDGTNPIADQDVTISGVSATANINKNDGTLTGVAGNITVHTGDDGCFYMALIPQSGEVTFTFSGPGDGTTTFPNGIRECSFYSEQGSGNPLQVTTVEKVKPFTVGMDNGKPRRVEFAPGNLYYNGADNGHKMNANLPSGWNFYEHQWDCYPSGTELATELMEISLFTWGYGDWSTDYSTTSYQTGLDVTMTDWGSHAIGSDPAGTWRTLSRAEWNYLLGFDPEQYEQTDSYGRPDAKNLCGWKELDDGEHNGLVILPDGTEDPETVMGSINSTADLATYGAVFLPAAGGRYGTVVYDVGSHGYYWSGTPSEDYEDHAYDMYFYSGYVSVSNDYRVNGNAVRLVR